VEDVCISGHLARSLNSTFLALIPKINNPQHFGDFRPISLCNLIYKVTSKVLLNQIKPILSKSLLAEQFGFLEGRQIHDAIGTTHECIHSLTKKNKKSLILNIDMQKAYDLVDWDFLRLILLQVGFGLAMTNWIMACVNSTSLAVLVNGEATNFFRSGRGLRQGCLLSPLLFILMMETLSLLLKNSQREGSLLGIKVLRLSKILHLFFVDDVLLLTYASL
jgi:hypothetical protein